MLRMERHRLIAVHISYCKSAKDNDCVLLGFPCNQLVVCMVFSHVYFSTFFFRGHVGG